MVASVLLTQNVLRQNSHDELQLNDGVVQWLLFGTCNVVDVHRNQEVEGSDRNAAHSATNQHAPIVLAESEENEFIFFRTKKKLSE